MVEQLGKHYSNYLIQSNISKELHIVTTSIDDMVARLDEFEHLVNMVKTDSAISLKANIPEIYACKEDFNILCNKIDKLEAFVSVVHQNLNQLECQVATAEEELGINDTGIKGFLKPIFGKSKSESEIGNQNKIYEPVEIFKTSDYFPESQIENGIFD